MIRFSLILALLFYFINSPVICSAEGQPDERDMVMEEALDNKKWEISESFHYERSEAELSNAGAEVNLYEVDTKIRRCFEKASLSLTIPYIYQKNDIRITRSLQRFGQAITISRENQRSNEGLGDFTLDGSYYLLTEDDKFPVDISLYGYVKFPSLDEDHSFGTRQYDAGPGFGLSKLLFEKWQISSNIYYTFIGDTPEQDLRNEFRFDGGLSCDVTSKITLSVTYEQSNALLKQTTSDYQDIFAMINYSFNDTISFFAEKIFELNNDYLKESLTGGVTARF